MAVYTTKAVEPGAVFTAAARKAAAQGGVLLGLVRFPHPHDHYLYQALVDLSQTESGEVPAVAGLSGDKFVVWFYNASDNGFYHGSYHHGEKAREAAYADFTRTYVDRMKGAFGRTRL